MNFIHSVSYNRKIILISSDYKKIELVFSKEKLYTEIWKLVRKNKVYILILTNKSHSYNFHPFILNRIFMSNLKNYNKHKKCIQKIWDSNSFIILKMLMWWKVFNWSNNSVKHIIKNTYHLIMLLKIPSKEAQNANQN